MIVIHPVLFWVVCGSLSLLITLLVIREHGLTRDLTCYQQLIRAYGLHQLLLGHALRYNKIPTRCDTMPTLSPRSALLISPFSGESEPIVGLRFDQEFRSVGGELTYRYVPEQATSDEVFPATYELTAYDGRGRVLVALYGSDRGVVVREPA